VSAELAIDAERLTGPRAGVARYLSALLASWATVELPFERVTLYAPGPIPRDVLPERHGFRVRTPGGRVPKPVWTQWTLARAARGADVLFCPSYVVPVAYRGKAVVTIHDTIHEVMPESFSRWSRLTRRPLYRLSAQRAALVLTDSQSSREDIVRAYGLAGNRVEAIPLGVDSTFRDVADDEQRRVRKRYRLAEAPFVLFVGKFSRRRNLPTLVRAFAQLLRTRDTDALLVLAGDDHLHLGLEDVAAQLSIGERVRILGHVPDEDLPGLYAAAALLAYPSDYEGFGLPILEAMAAGTAVLTLDNSSLREVTGDAALLLPAATVEGLAAAMARLLEDAPFRRRLERLGEDRSLAFSWAGTAALTMSALARVAEGAL
jgi:glycosyltransferase involved in cell wall biosynthesis